MAARPLSPDIEAALAEDEATFAVVLPCIQQELSRRPPLMIAEQQMCDATRDAVNALLLQDARPGEAADDVVRRQINEHMRATK